MINTSNIRRLINDLSLIKHVKHFGDNIIVEPTDTSINVYTIGLNNFGCKQPVCYTLVFTKGILLEVKKQVFRHRPTECDIQEIYKVFKGV